MDAEGASVWLPFACSVVASRSTKIKVELQLDNWVLCHHGSAPLLSTDHTVDKERGRGGMELFIWGTD
jgi:hypothetical protein